MKKTTDQAYEILEDTTTNSNQWPRDRSAPRKPLVGAETEVLSNLVNLLVLWRTTQNCGLSIGTDDSRASTVCESVESTTIGTV